MREGIEERAVDSARDIELESKGYQDGNQKPIQKYAYFFLLGVQASSNDDTPR